MNNDNLENNRNYTAETLREPAVPPSLEAILRNLRLPRKYVGPSPWYRWIKEEGPRRKYRG